MLFSYWLILFTTACYANILGLNISAGLNSVITIYILVPFLLIPQIIFCGVLVKYDKLHKSLTNYEYIPVIGDLMASRWAFEALAVNQFKNNQYDKMYFDVNQQISTVDYLQAFLIPQLELKLDHIVLDLEDGLAEASTVADFNLLKKELGKLGKQVTGLPAFDTDRLDLQTISDSTVEAVRTYLKEVTDLSRSAVGKGKSEKSKINKMLIDKKKGLEGYTDFRNEYDNKKLDEMLIDRFGSDKVIEKDGRLIRKHQPVYMIPSSGIGRAQLYAPVKRFGNLEIDTVWYNVLILWLYSLVFYVVLYFDLLSKLLAYLETLRFIRKRST